MSELLIETLVEDRSGSYLIEPLLNRMLQDLAMPHVIHMRPHKGLGHWPNPANEFLSVNRLTALDRARERKDPERLLLGPDNNMSRGRGLYHFLGAKLRAYEQICRNHPLIVLIVQDADRNPLQEVKNDLLRTIKRETQELITVIGIAVEELEAWILSDSVALFRAYPEADHEIYRRYKQDSIIGTWEFLAKVILGERRASTLIAQGYPLSGKYKTDWALRIGPLLRPARMDSPSFRRFEADLKSAIKKLQRSYDE